MTTLEETVVGVLAAITTPMRRSELRLVCSLKSSSTSPKTKKGMMIKLIICIRRCNLIRRTVCASVCVRSERPEIKKMIITHPTRSCQIHVSCCILLSTCWTYPTLLTIRRVCIHPS